jgi:hypothetical protein
VTAGRHAAVRLWCQHRNFMGLPSLRDLRTAASRLVRNRVFVACAWALMPLAIAVPYAVFLKPDADLPHATWPDRSYVPLGLGLDPVGPMDIRPVSSAAPVVASAAVRPGSEPTFRLGLEDEAAPPPLGPKRPAYRWISRRADLRGLDPTLVDRSEPTRLPPSARRPSRRA